MYSQKQTHGIRTRETVSWVSRAATASSIGNIALPHKFLVQCTHTIHVCSIIIMMYIHVNYYTVHSVTDSLTSTCQGVSMRKRVSCWCLCLTSLLAATSSYYRALLNPRHRRLPWEKVLPLPSSLSQSFLSILHFWPSFLPSSPPGQLSWLVYLIGCVVGGKMTHTTTSEYDSMDGQLVCRYCT